MGEEVMEPQPRRTPGAVRREHPWFAAFYSRVSVSMERGGMAAYRARLLEGLHGEVVELGPGNGLNFRHYPAAVTRLVAVEPEPNMRERARKAVHAEQAVHAAREAQGAQPPGTRIEVIGGVAERLPLADASCDAVVASLMLCSVSQQETVLAEVERVLRPGGEFRFLEHVRSLNRVAALGQRALDATIWPRLGAGCHCARQTGEAVVASGLELRALDRFRFPPTPLAGPSAPHVLGIARKAG
ncbi:class I SAM-dependent methyltransferase [Actinocrinis puniceicyclus]|uniref:Class I SAM-dependent methyltransferase n=1 Tax=Actinocrinis puniceicyclus TaxID=977794 RepID=A0A8J7WRN2_9ACTN|nr:class I SAM-dependent methyltransferase [Actinocrinis puniceicyclus]MBS2964919.1 class I SAM-dependent methyltransferase [Actinocrinis puniceicyclus]